MKQLHILVSGAGICGPVLAYWLDRAGHRVTVLEKDHQLRATGQSIDIREAAVEVVRKMGLEAQIREKTTSEEGLAFVDKNNVTRALFPASKDQKVQSFTAEFEIFRGDLAAIFYNATKDLPNVNYLFSESIAALDSQPDHITATFSSGREAETYDLVVAADGLGSQTRSLAFSSNTRDFIWSLDTHAAYFTIPIDLLDGSQYSAWYNAPGGRVILLRPDQQRNTRAHLSVIHHDTTSTFSTFANAFKRGPEGIREIMTSTFQGAGWKTDVILKYMADAKDLYGSEIAQIRTPSLVQGRTVLVGDAGYCPTPFTGMGTSLAIIGAYVLAGEIAKSSEDVPSALKGYEDIIFPFVKKVQNVPRAMPRIVNPDTEWGIKVQLFIFGVVAWLRLDRLVQSVASFFPGGTKFELPEYHWD